MRLPVHSIAVPVSLLVYSHSCYSTHYSVAYDTYRHFVLSLKNSTHGFRRIMHNLITRFISAWMHLNQCGCLHHRKSYGTVIRLPMESTML